MLLGVMAYLIAMAMTVYDGLLSLIFQPILGLIITGMACVILTIVASPLLITRIWRLWQRLWLLPLLLIPTGIVLMIISWLPPLRVQVWHPELQMPIDSFHPGLGIGGWAVMLFGILWFPKFSLTRDGRWA